MILIGNLMGGIKMKTEQLFHDAICDIFEERRIEIKKLVSLATVDKSEPDDFPLRLALNKSIPGFPEFDFLMKSDIKVSLFKNKESRSAGARFCWLPARDEMSAIFRLHANVLKKADNKQKPDQ